METNTACDLCTMVFERTPTYSYIDKKHGGEGGVERIVHGNLDRDETVRITGCYIADELKTDGGDPGMVGKEWHVDLEIVAPPPHGEDRPNRWFFGNFSMKEGSPRHADYYVRYRPEPLNKPLEFFKELPERVFAETNPEPENVWVRVLPNTCVTMACAQRL